MPVDSSVFDAIDMLYPQIKYIRNEPMRNHASFKIGGTVDTMFFPSCTRDVNVLHSMLRECNMKPFYIGNGTNLLVEDSPLDICVIKTTNITQMALFHDTEIHASSGVLLSQLSSFACKKGLSGLEFANGIPGTLGGAIVMNAGAYGRQMSDVVARTNAFSYSNNFMLDDNEHKFGHRTSRFSNLRAFVSDSVLKLTKDDPKEIAARMEEFSKRRRESQPLNYPSAGSTFKRPKDGYAAEMIEKAGLKGYTVGGACVSEKHSGFIINRDNASFSDVIAVIEHVKEEVFKMFGTELELEVKILRTGENGVVWS